MGQTNINIRMDEKLKKDFDKLCNELGLTMTTAFNIFARTVVRRNGIPFPVEIDIPNEETIKAIEDVKLRRNLSGPYNSVKELIADLNNDD